MANDIEKLVQDLNRAKEAAAQAELEITRLTAQLEKLLASAAKGGVPVQERLTQIAQELATGQREAAGRVRAGGGARINLKKIEDAINAYIQEIVRANEQLIRSQQVLARPEIKALTGLAAVRSTPEPAPEQVTPITTKVPDIPQNILRNYDKLYGDLSNFIALQQKYPGVVEVVKRKTEELGFASSRTSVQVKELGNGFARLNITFGSGGTRLGPFISYIDQLGNELSEVDYKAKRAAASVKVFTAQDLERMLGQTRYQAAITKAGQYGFAPTDLTKQFTQQPTGVSFLTFQKETEQGLQKMQLTVDKFGRVITQTNRRLLDFFSAIARNTAEVIRWSIGATAVYSALFKLQDLVRVAIDNETRLADITVTLGDNQRDVNEIFEDASRIAVATGENINGVLEAYTMAYRAVGAVEDPIKRTAAANKLLTDSIILSKLSTLEQAQSIDVLAGAIRQLQQPGETFEESLERGRVLLDQWVAVTRKANVDLATLATAFSITAESADNAGVSTEELTAIIASISEKIGGLGGRETGNAVRALIGGVYQGQAAETLGRYGIAITDVNGKMRDWLDIMREIAGYSEQKLISTDQLNQIAYVLGGGVRRGQQYVAVLGDIGRVDQIVAYQTNVQGAAQEALGKKLDTVQTAITNLSNAFQRLAQTLGSEGGVLDTTRGLLTVFTGILNIVSELTRVLGRLTIPAALLAFGAAYFRGPTGALKRESFVQGLGGIVGGLATGVLGAVPGMRQQVPGTGVGGYSTTPGGLLVPGQAGYTKAQLAGQGVGAWTQKYGLGMLLGAGPAISRAGQGEWGAAGADIGGAIIGTLMAGGNPIGGIIGAAIADVFVAETLTYKPDFRNLFKDVFPKPEEEVEPGMKTQAETVADQQEELIRQMFEGLGGVWGEEVGKFRARMGALGTNILMGGYGVTQRAMGREFRYEGVTPEQFALAQPAFKTPFGFGKLTAEQQEILKQIQDLQKAAPVEVQLPKLIVTEEDKRIIEDIQNQLRASQLQALFKRDIKPKEYSDVEERIQGLLTRLPMMENAFGDAFDTMRDDINSTADLYQIFADVVTQATAEDTERINQLVTEIITLEKGIKGLQETGQAFVGGKGDLGEPIEYTIENIDEAIRKLEELRNQVVNVFQGLSKEIQIQKIELPQIISLETQPQYVDEIIAEAQRLEDLYLQALTPDERAKYEAERTVARTLIEIWVNGMKQFYQGAVPQGIPGEFFTQAFQGLTAKGAVPETGRDVGIRQLDVTSAQLNQALARYEPFLRMLEGMGYQRDEQTEIAILGDGVVRPLTKDFKIIQLLLQDILDVNKKQLEGVYNLPADSSFYVPFQGYKLGFGQGGGGGVNWQALPENVEDGTYRGARDGVLEGLKDFTQHEKDRPSPTRDIRTQLGPGIGRERIEGALTRIPTPYNPSIGIERFEGAVQPAIELPEIITGDVITNAIDKAITNLGTMLFPKFDALITAFESFPEIIARLFKLPTLGQVEGDVNQTMLASLKTEMPKVENKLSLNINTTAQLLVDGRLMAAVVKQYLYEDLLRGTGISGSNAMTITI